MGLGKDEYALFAKYGRDYIKLGRKIDSEFGYRGTNYRVGDRLYRFPSKWLQIMVDRFYAINGPQNVELITIYKLLDCRDDPDEPENAVFQVGSGAYSDPPFSKYIPEMFDEPNFEDQLIRLRQTRTGTRLGGKVDPQTGKWVFPDGPPQGCLLYTSPSPRDQRGSRMPSSA